MEPTSTSGDAPSPQPHEDEETSHLWNPAHFSSYTVQHENFAELRSSDKRQQVELPPKNNKNSKPIDNRCAMFSRNYKRDETPMDVC